MATTKAKETQAEDLKTVTVKSADPNKVGLWERSPAYKSVKGAVEMAVDDGEGGTTFTYEIFIRNEPVSVPRTSEVQAAINQGRLEEVGKE